jgi:hypothetical protein
LADGKTRPRDVAHHLHEKMYALIEPIDPNDPEKKDGWGRQFCIKKWSLDGTNVCREAWKLARGGSARQHRLLYAMVCRGHGPADSDAHGAVKRVLSALEKETDASGKGVLDEKRGFASNWWKEYFLLCDWLPNEERIQIRGPSYDILHKDVYGASAKAVGMHLSYKVWRECAQEGLRQVASLLPGSDPARLKASRAARHSKFPECQARPLAHMHIGER